jgi:hypothetical protein
MMRRPRKRPSHHKGRGSREAREFAATFFETADEQRSAVHVFNALEAFTGLDLSGLEPDDVIGEIIPPPDSLDQVETMMGLDDDDDALQKRPLIEAAIEELFWARVLRTLLGPSAASCSWDPQTLPLRTVRSVVLQAAR